MGWVSVISGFMAVVVSPIIWALLGNWTVIYTTLIASPILALIALVFGILSAVKGDQFGYVGIILAVVAWVLIFLVVLAMTAPTLI